MGKNMTREQRKLYELARDLLDKQRFYDVEDWTEDQLRVLGGLSSVVMELVYHTCGIKK